MLAVSARRSGPDRSGSLTAEEQQCYIEIRFRLFCTFSALSIQAHITDWGTYLATARGLIRTDTLQAYARLLAQQTEAVKAGDRNDTPKQRLCQLLKEAGGLLSCLVDARTLCGASSPVRPQAQRLLRALCAALAHSALLEHLARALLLVAEVGQGGFEDAVDCTDLCRACSALCSLLPDSPASPAAPASRRHAHLRAVLSGRCLQHLMACQLVATLCAVGGGPSYGLPLELSLRLSLLPRSHLFCMPGCVLETGTLAAALTAFARAGVSVPTRLRPLRAFALLLRLARAAVAAMQSRPPAAGPGPTRQRLPLPAAECARLAETALDSCDRILAGPLAARAAAATAAAAAAAPLVVPAAGPAPAAAAAAAAAPGPDVRALRRQWWQGKVELAQARAGRA